MKVLALVMAATLAGCASSGDTTKKGDGYRCEQVSSLGSIIPKKRCTTSKERKLIHDESQESLRQHQRNGVLTGGG
ncbi:MULTISPECIES: hypothetical protein [Pseudoalteromonas]|uniref:Lipoprotein n=1 Tax=Pseudoalteromonas obscura TaxID=3048491 RepID=A0ABT7EHN8_9GAMM|nr:MULTISPECIES: hypothetical protein [Pseudoalteromonas]MBQ4836212.1 hypothetical protein [Pseudoalteromonas luteoviolacea]MDK2594562.1 hypothetical protein [Pseudoalteromonas sp. P94(2023)]